jgi:futalosine hydrolase
MKTKKRPLILVPSEFEAGALEGLNLEIKLCGIGVIEAALESYRLIKSLEPSLVILTGLAGAYPETELLPGDLVIASKEVWADSGKRLKEGYLPLGEDLAMVRELELDEELVFKVFRFPSDLRVKTGTMCTVCACSYEPERALIFRQKYQALAENMEGFAVALVAQKAGVPFAEIRVISNLLSDPQAPWEIEKAFNSLRRFWEWQSIHLK